MPFKNIRFVNFFLGIFFQMGNNLFKLYWFRSFKSVIFLFDERTSESFFLSAIVWELSCVFGRNPDILNKWFY